jgi:hypothetical protein
MDIYTFFQLFYCDLAEYTLKEHTNRLVSRMKYNLWL